MTLGTAGGGAGMDMEIAAAGNTEVIRAKHNNMEALGLTGDIEDMLITLDTQIHILRPLKKEPDLFIYIALEKSQANLAMARLKMRQIEGSLEV
jgi:sugar lactone lactonase YvrE